MDKCLEVSLWLETANPKCVRGSRAIIRTVNAVILADRAVGSAKPMRDEEALSGRTTACDHRLNEAVDHFAAAQRRTY